ncbi:MAG: anti-sigma factor [Pyrinomonadaceae bacterium]|nr:anti-sigma factor [Pyrinomonadaceae bacterium]
MNDEKHTRLLDLSATKALFGLEESEAKELEKLRREQPEIADESWEHAAAALHLNRANASEQMPLNLRNKIAAQAQIHFAANKTENSVQNKIVEFSPKRKFDFWGFGGWAVAATACIALFYVIWFAPLQQQQQIQIVENAPPQALSLSQQREMLIASAGDLRQISWSNAGTNQNFKVNGDVVWSDERQEGFMRFRGLPVNDKARETYQLWIFAANQEQKYPVDGGIFDASQQSANDEIIVPIKAKLRVENPSLFAVSIEKPDGVVVSRREKIIAVAKS